MREVTARTGLSRSSIYLKVKEGTFPKQLKLGERSRSMAWLESDIDSWMDSIIAAREFLKIVS
ncbi:helix-turn-helix transcriptional regulator [Candidatus Methylobacter favarea]